VLRVVHVINGEHFGGIERAVALLATACGRVSPSVVCLMGDDEARVRAAMRGCPVEVVRMRHRADVTAAVRLARVARASGCDLLHAHTLRAALVAAAAARLARVPVVATLHSPIARDTEDDARNRRNLRVQRRLFRWIAGHIAVSEGIREEAIRAGAAPASVTVIRNGIDIARYAGGDPRALRGVLDPWPADAPLVGTHALLRPRKGLDVLIRAIPLIAQPVPSARFVIAGNAETPAYELELRALAGDLGVADRIAFVGFRDDVADVLAALDVFVMPSLYGEGTPFAVLEAMAAARCIVATRTEGIVETVTDGETGALVPSGDPEALAHALVAVLTDDRRRRALGENARRAALTHFAVGRMAATTESFYRATLTGPTSS
jgi:glycosyltransferase involved in cell wall biosynthesis